MVDDAVGAREVAAPGELVEGGGNAGVPGGEGERPGAPPAPGGPRRARRRPRLLRRARARGLRLAPGWAGGVVDAYRTLPASVTDEQRARILRPMAAADVLWAQGWSEPGAGSDLAAVKSTAVRVDGGWKLSGQKTWSTRAEFCHAVHGLFRTDPAAARHKGMTYFLVPLDAPGVRVNGFRRLDGDQDFAEIFFDDVFVGDADVLGPVNEGWKVAMSTTGSANPATRPASKCTLAAEKGGPR